jgi:hypothetical protein
MVRAIMTSSMRRTFGAHQRWKNFESSRIDLEPLLYTIR